MQKLQKKTNQRTEDKTTSQPVNTQIEHTNAQDKTKYTTEKKNIIYEMDTVSNVSFGSDESIYVQESNETPQIATTIVEEYIITNAENDQSDENEKFQIFK